MNAKELIFSVPTHELAARHIAQLREMPDTQINDGNLETAIANMSAFIEKLADIEPIETNHIILGIRHLMHDEESLSASLFRKDELLCAMIGPDDLNRIKIVFKNGKIMFLYHGEFPLPANCCTT